MTLAPDRLRQRVARDECERDGKDCEEGEEQKCSSASVVVARFVFAVVARFASVVIEPSALAFIARSVFAVVRFASAVMVCGFVPSPVQRSQKQDEDGEAEEKKAEGRAAARVVRIRGT